jgi:enamine deaminase RidA (YjgF/YER057c/UK114 family)
VRRARRVEGPPVPEPRSPQRAGYRKVPRSAEGKTVGDGDLAAQVEQSLLNVGTALAGVGASFADVVKLTVHVVDWTPDRMPELLDGIARASVTLGTGPMAPVSLFGIVALDVPEHLVEIEATAVLE